MRFRKGAGKARVSKFGGASRADGMYKEKIKFVLDVHVAKCDNLVLDPDSSLNPGGFNGAAAWLNVHLTKPFLGNNVVTNRHENNIYFNDNPG